MFFIVQKIKKNKKRKASNKELELFIENNVLNEKVSDKNITIKAAKVSVTEKCDIKYYSEILSIAEKN